jgi:type IV pilus assembly protein PilB
MSTWLESIKEKIPENALKEAQQKEGQGSDPADYILKGGFLSAADLLASLSLYHDRPALMLGQYEPDDEAIAKVPEDVARRFALMPLFILKKSIFVAIADPGNVEAEDYIRQQTGLSMEELVTTKENIDTAINRHYLKGERSAEKVRKIVAEKKEDEKEELEDVIRLDSEEAPSIKLANHIISSAIRLGASDIHLEATDDGAWLRYRLDGVLREFPPPPPDLLRAITARIKVTSDMDVSEKRLPQDGRSSFTIDNREYDLRVSIIPGLYGESVVIRILDTGRERQKLEDLGFEGRLLEDYERMIVKPHGIVLVTGPTGSGKSTTLYATLRHILTPEKKILSLEDPVEAQIRGVTQFQMNSQIGYTFAKALRSVLRHDPEIVLLGEIRDLETAEIAIRASLTGHMLFSTLHTNDAPSSATRLIDMGVPGFMVMSTLIGVIAQRLVRRLCAHCKAPLEVEEIHLAAVNLSKLPDKATPYRPVGCTECSTTGYKGRIAIYELLDITPEMKRLKEAEMTAEVLREMAQKNNFVSLRDSALKRWYDGVTSLDEVIKITIE